MKQNKLILVLSLTSLIGLSGLSFSNHNNSYSPTKTNRITRKLGRLNSENKEASLNAVGEIALETLDKYVDSNKYSIERIIEIKDFGDNQYVLVEFNPIGYLIYNVSNGDIVECAPTSYSPYLKTKSNNLLYVPMVGYFSNISGKYTNLMEEKEVNDKELKSYRQESSRYHNKAITKIDETNVNRISKGSNKEVKRVRKNAEVENFLSSTMIYADTEVPYSWYFKKNSCEFATAFDSCGYVAAGLVLAYNEIFLSAGYFSPQQVSDYIYAFEGSNFGEGVPIVDDEFLYELDDELGGTSQYQIKTAINNFMEGKGKTYTIKESSSILTNIEKPINDGYPAIYLGGMPDFEGGTVGHAVVVYGLYDNTDVLCHYGWSGYSQVIMTRLGIFEQGGVISIYDNSRHAHNRYFILNNLTYCGCGEYVTC